MQLYIQSDKETNIKSWKCYIKGILILIKNK